MSESATLLSHFGRPRGAAHLAVILAVLAPAAPAHAQPQAAPSLVLLPGSGRDVSAAIVVRGRWLLGQSLGRPGRFAVLDHDGPPTVEPVSPAEAAAVARRLGAAMAVSFDISSAGNQTTLALRCIGAADARPLCELRETTAAGPELLPEFAEWLTERLLRTLGRPAAAGAPGGAAETASRTEPRTTTLGLRVGLFVPVASPADELSLLGTFGAVINVDSGGLLVDLTGEYGAGADGRLLGAGLGFFVPATDATPNSLYAGGAVFWVDQRLGGRGAQGVQLRPTVGMLWGRRATARTRLELSYFVDLFSEQQRDRLIPGSDRSHVAHGLIFSTGATF